jgi:flavin reductase (DIM6/NTAB) family NADH-FMN oxidoreductase RutF
MAFPAPVWCVCTYDSKGEPNVMTAAWGGIACSKPPALTVSLRQATYTYQALMERRAYCVNVPSAGQMEAADYFGMVSGRDTDKFADTGLTPVRGEHVDAPCIEEFPMSIECRVTHTLEVGLHTMFVGEIMEIWVDAVAMEDGKADLAKVAPVIFSPGNRGYYAPGARIGQGFSSGARFKK